MAITRTIRVDGVSFSIFDYPRSWVANSVEKELNDLWLTNVPFDAGDVVLDIGAHIGIVSIYLAILHPEITIYAFEPVPDNFKLLKKNLSENGIKNVVAKQVAITSDGRDLELTVNLDKNSGGSTPYIDPSEGKVTRVQSLRFDSVLKDNCKLLKIDCEGSEYEILYGSKRLKNIEYLSAEIHVQPALIEKGYIHSELVDFCNKNFDPDKLHLKVWPDNGLPPSNPWKQG